MMALLRVEIVAALLLPVAMGLLHRRGVRVQRCMPFAAATALAVLVGTFALWPGGSQTWSPLAVQDWLLAIALAAIAWGMVYLISRWLSRKWFQ